MQLFWKYRNLAADRGPLRFLWQQFIRMPTWTSIAVAPTFVRLAQLGDFATKTQNRDAGGTAYNRRAGLAHQRVNAQASCRVIKGIEPSDIIRQSEGR
jgi:hypothetical protein